MAKIFMGTMRRLNVFFRKSQPGIYLTQRIADRIPDTIPVTPAGEVETQSGTQRVWRIETRVREP